MKEESVSQQPPVKLVAAASAARQREAPSEPRSVTVFVEDKDD